MSLECEELSQLTDLNERIEHEMLGCPVCLDLRTRSLLETSKAKDTVIPVQVPIELPSQNNGDETTKSNRHQNLKRPAKKSDDHAIPQSKKKMLDKLVIRDMVNLEGISKSEAAVRIVEGRRIRPKIDAKDEKINVPANEMPWVPEPSRWIRFPPNSQSCLKISDHRRYVAIISNLLTPKPSFRFDLNKLELQGIDERLKPEREKLLEFAAAHINKFKNSPYSVRINGSEALFVKRERSKILNSFRNLEFCDVIRSVEWPSFSSVEIIPGTFYLKTHNVFAEGKSHRIRIPNVRRRCQYNINSRIIEDNLNLESKGKLPIEADENAINFALDYNLDYIMDACTLRHLLSEKWPHRHQSFVNRVSVIRRIKNCITNRVCIISKPLLASEMDLLYINHQHMKWCAKSEVRRDFEKQRDYIHRAKHGGTAHTSNSTPHRSTSDTKLATEVKPELNEQKFQDNDSQSDFESNLVVAEDDFEKPEPTESGFNIQIKEEVNNGNDLLGDILTSMGSSDFDQTAKLSDKVSEFNPANLITSFSDVQPMNNNLKKAHRYASIQLDATEKHVILVRSSSHGVDQEGKHISLTVKNEYLPEIGSQKADDEELIWSWVTAILKGSTEHITLYMNPRNGHCIQLRRSDPKRILSDFSHQLKQLVWSRIQRVCTLIDKLDALDVGEYLLVQDDCSIKILQEHSSTEQIRHIASEPKPEIEDDEEEKEMKMEILTDDVDLAEAVSFEEKPAEVIQDIYFDIQCITKKVFSSVYKASSLLDICQFSRKARIFESDAQKLWTTIDEHVPLVWHLVQGRIPGSLFPLINKPRVDGKSDSLEDGVEKQSTGKRKRRRRKQRC